MSVIVYPKDVKDKKTFSGYYTKDTAACDIKLYRTELCFINSHR